MQCATGSKILTEPEPYRIGIILAGTGPERDYKPEKVNRIRPDKPEFLPDFLKTLTLNLQDVKNMNVMAASYYVALALSIL